MKIVRELGFAERARNRGIRRCAREPIRSIPLEVARFKYLFNFVLPAEDARSGSEGAFCSSISATKRDFARELYLNWSEAREMQRAGMVIGRPLARAPAARDPATIPNCPAILRGTGI